MGCWFSGDETIPGKINKHYDCIKIDDAEQILKDYKKDIKSRLSKILIEYDNNFMDYENEILYLRIKEQIIKTFNKQTKLNIEISEIICDYILGNFYE